jgi:hypothetical protein
MTLKTVTVSIAAGQSNGTIPTTSRITFTLTGADIDVASGEIVVPDTTTVTLDGSGNGSVQKWPNARGNQGTQYLVTVESPIGIYRIVKHITVPDYNCDLYTLFDLSGTPSSSVPTLTQLAASTGSSLVGHGSGTVATALNGVAAPSFADLSALVGDGVTDDTTALAAAIATGNRVLGARGKTYKITNTLTITDKCVDFSGATIVYAGPKNQFAMVINSTSGVNSSCDVRNFVLSSTDTDTTNRTHGLNLGGSCGALDNVRIQGFTGISLAMGSGAESYTGVTLPAAQQCYYWNVSSVAIASTSGWNFVVPSANNANHFRNLSCFPFGSGSIPRAYNCIAEYVLGGTANTFERISAEASPSSRVALFLSTANGNRFLGRTYIEFNTNWTAPPYPIIEAQSGSSDNSLEARFAHSAVVPILDSGTANNLRITPSFSVNGSQVYAPSGGVNMVKNGRFENGSNYWSDFSSGSVMSFGTGYLSGKSMRLDVTAGRPNVLQDLVATGGYQLAALLGRNITVSSFVRTNLSGVSVKLAGTAQNQVPSDGNWFWFASTASVPSNASSVSVQLISEASGLTGFVECSNVIAVLGNEPQAVDPRQALTGSATYNPPSLTTGSETTTTVTVTGAALGDFVIGVSFSLDTQGIKLNGRVSAADTVTVTFRNDTGSTIDLASGTLAAIVTKQ